MPHGGADISRLEGESELTRFLKVARPQWAKTGRQGRSDLQKAIDKLKAIGVTDPWELVSRVTSNRLNKDLYNAGHSRFSRDTLECMRKQGSYFRALENQPEAHYRQVGAFAPVPRLLSRRNPRARVQAPPSPSRPMSEPCGLVGGESLGFSSRPGFPGFDSSPTRRRSLSLVVDPMTFGETPEDGQEETFSRPRLRGYRGVVAGTAGRPSTSSSLPGLGTTLRPPEWQGTGTSTPFTGDGAETQLLANSALFARARESSTYGGSGGRSAGRPRPRTSDGFDLSGSSGAWAARDLEAELSELQFIASGGGNRDTEELYERLARMGEEDMLSLKQSEPFLEQGGSETQVVRIAASYAKVGLPVSLTVRTLQNPALNVSEVRTQLDRTAVRNMLRAGGAMTKPRAARWTTEARAGRNPSDPTLRRASAILREQEALQEKAQLYRQMELAGQNSPMRHYIAGNIISRLKEEKGLENDKMEAQQQCNNIRRNLILMGNTKRDVGSLRRLFEAEEAKHAASNNTANNANVGSSMAYSTQTVWPGTSQ